MVLKPNMAIAGKKNAKRAGVEEVAEKTVRVLKNCVPAAVPGIAFLVGRTKRRAGDRPSRRHEQVRQSAVDAHVLLRPRAAARAADGLEGQSGECRRRSARVFHRAKMNGLAALGHGKRTWRKKQPDMAKGAS